MVVIAKTKNVKRKMQNNNAKFKTSAPEFFEFYVVVLRFAL
jgi:hypothetical protein